MDNQDLKYDVNLAAFEKNNSLYNHKVFDSWEGFSIICPNVDDDIFLLGAEDEIKNTAILFMINRCHPDDVKEGELPCKSPKEIDDFVDKVQVETWKK
jgi:hypothetical protein